MIERFTFHIDFGTGEQQVYPAVDDLVFKDEKDSDFGFYRRVLETQLPFLNRNGANDFNAFLAPELSADCQSYDLEIRYDGDPFYTGTVKYSTANMAWDLDRCRVDVRLEPMDAYTCLFEGWEDEFNILDEKYARQEVSLLTGSFEFFGCEDGPFAANEYLDYIDCIPGGAASLGWTVTNHYAENNDDPTSYKVLTNYMREVITVGCTGGIPDPPPGDGWILVEDNCPTNAKYARPVQTIPNPNGSIDGFPTGVPNDRFYIQDFTVIGRAANGGTLAPLPNGVLLNDILEEENPCDGLTVVSNLLNINPSGPSPATAPYTNPRTHGLVVYQKTAIKYLEGAEAESIGIWTYLEILQYLKYAYDAEPRVVGSELRIEHSTYWGKDNGLDLTTGTFLQRIAGQNKYTYASSRIPRKETWKYYEPVSIAFAGSSIEYSCFAGDDLPEAVRTIERVNNDVPYALANRDRIAEDGFVVLETQVIGSDRVAISRYIYPDTTTPYLNGAHSVGSLIDHFHRWQRPVITGTMGGNPETFTTAQRRKAQVELKPKISAEDYRDFLADDLVRSEIGWGEVDSVTWAAKSCVLTVNLLHD